MPKESNLIYGSLFVFLGSAFAASGIFQHATYSVSPMSEPEILVRVGGFVLLAIGGFLVLGRYAWPLREELKSPSFLALIFWLLLCLAVVLPFGFKSYGILMNNLPSAIHLGVLLIIGHCWHKQLKKIFRSVII